MSIVPGAAALAALLLAWWLPVAEERLTERHTAWYLLVMQPDSARDLLSTIAASMMTLTGLVFSITILVLQLASSQFSPRILGTFLEDKLTRMAMATFIGTFVYAMALLPEVHDAGAPGGERVPAFSVFVAFALVILSVGVFVRYIHGMAHSIRAVHVVRRVARDAWKDLDVLYPETACEPEEPVALPDGPPLQVIRNGVDSGVLAAVDDAELFELAVRSNAVIALVPQLGDFIPHRGRLFEVWAAAPIPEHCLRDCVVLEEERTPQQDIAFAFRQLVDVAERALSPGINDPTTAVQAIDQIQDLLLALANRRFPSVYRLDEAGELRLVLPRPDWDALVRLAFDEIRQYGRGSIQVVRRLRSALLSIRATCPQHRRQILDLELGDLDRAAEELYAPADRAQARRPSPQGQGA